MTALNFFARVFGWLKKPLVKANFNSAEYWEHRYSSGGNSGAGSYDRLAAFKADVLNSFAREHSIASVIEFGCGDGNQLRLANYDQYQGFDVSAEAVASCRHIFREDTTKSFDGIQNYLGTKAELGLSLDVIFHLVEDRVFDEYMNRLFDAATRYVIIYSSNEDEEHRHTAPHVRHRKFTAWISSKRPQWKLVDRIPNKYPYQPEHPETTSFSDFWIYERQ